MTPLRITIFLVIALSVWTLLHAYVFLRLATVPALSQVLGTPAVAGIVALWAAYPLGRVLISLKADAAGMPLEFAGTTWMGFLFLLFASMIAVDIVTAGGLVFVAKVPLLRGWAAAAAVLLGAAALVQGLRPPVLREYEVRLAGLPQDRDGLVLVAVSDLHLGTLIGGCWMERLVGRVEALKPDAVVVVGDLVDAEVGRLESLLPVLRTLKAPLGVWAVTGNHEYFAGLGRSVELLKAAGYTVLRDSAAEVAPGLVLAGVDDLGARRQFGQRDHAIEKALTARPPGAVIFLSHSPVFAGAEEAAARGAGLMLSGHTHGGQLWPFGLLVRMSTPFVAGRYEVAGMTVIVSRGTGTWGPRMRLWRPGEILKITLRAEPGSGAETQQR